MDLETELGGVVDDQSAIERFGALSCLVEMRLQHALMVGRVVAHEPIIRLQCRLRAHRFRDGRVGLDGQTLHNLLEASITSAVAQRRIFKLGDG